MSHEILDEFIENEDSKFYFPWFQGVDALFYLLFILIADVFFVKYEISANVFLNLWYVWMVFYLLKTSLEFKYKLITGWGILLTLFLGFFFLFVFPSLMIDRSNWEATKYVQLIVFIFVPIIMVFYPFALKHISKKIKWALFANFFLILALSSGAIYLLKMEVFSSIHSIPLVFSLFPLIIFVYIYKQPLSRKENYHVNWMAFVTIFYLYCFYINI